VDEMRDTFIPHILDDHGWRQMVTHMRQTHIEKVYEFQTHIHYVSIEHERLFTYVQGIIFE
ncbi:unnamed protein product, partial [Ilex paraguariensis]